MKGLAAYAFNSRKREMEIAIQVDKWKLYLCNERYALLHPKNAEVTTAFIAMKRFWKANINGRTNVINIMSFVLERKIVRHMRLRFVFKKYCCQLFLDGDPSNATSGEILRSM